MANEKQITSVPSAAKADKSQTEDAVLSGESAVIPRRSRMSVRLNLWQDKCPSQTILTKWAARRSDGFLAVAAKRINRF